MYMKQQVTRTRIESASHTKSCQNQLEVNDNALCMNEVGELARVADKEHRPIMHTRKSASGHFGLVESTTTFTDCLDRFIIAVLKHVAFPIASNRSSKETQHSAYHDI